MAAFNIINVATIIEGGASVVPANTARTALGVAPATGHVFEVGSITASNTTATAATAIVELYDGTNYRIICPTITIPPYASLIVVDKSQGISLVDATMDADAGAWSAVHVTSGTGSAITYVMSFKDLS
jgi:hypothetical protein